MDVGGWEEDGEEAEATSEVVALAACVDFRRLLDTGNYKMS